MGKFQELRVWQDAIELCQMIYVMTSSGAFSRDFGLSGQIQKAAVSIASNIAEGDERGTSKEAVHHFHIAKGSSAEVLTQLYIAHKIGYIDAESLQIHTNLCEKIRASLKKLIQSREGR